MNSRPKAATTRNCTTSRPPLTAEGVSCRWGSGMFRGPPEFDRALHCTWWELEGEMPVTRAHRWILLALIFSGISWVSRAEHPVYPLKASANCRYLVDQRSSPVFIKGDTPWSLASQVSREDVEVYLKQRAELGVNSLIITIPEGYYCDGCRDAEGPKDYYGNRPFLTRNKLTTPNTKYFEHADWVIRQ